MTKDEALDLALEALELEDMACRYEKESTPEHIAKAITAIKQARALDKMADNARELGLDYEPADGTQVSKVWWDGEKLMAKPIPFEDIYQSVDWKAEYLKSVESGCITLDELREARAELDATNRQVEILSDALAESRREVAAIKQARSARQEHEPENEPFVSLASVQERTDYEVHLNHCNIGECEGVCKYLDDDCPALKHADMKAKWDRPTPPAAQRQWVGLTPTERKQIEKRYVFVEDAIRLTEAKLKEKNNG